MIHRFDTRMVGLAFCLALLTACAAPTTNGARPQGTAMEPAPETSQPPPPGQSTPAPKLDDSCRSNADCTVKNVGSCCGEMPACVNRDSPVDPAAVQAQCAKEGRMSTCGFRQISACQCSDGTCRPQSSQPGLRGPVVPTEPVY